MAVRSLFSFFTAVCISAACALGVMANICQPHINGTPSFLDSAKMAGKNTPGWVAKHRTAPGVIKYKTP